MLGAAAVAGISAAADVGKGVFGLIQQKRQNKANKAMAEYAYSKELEQWNRQNEYNLPASQMARLKEAGLNPNMVYGSGGATTQAAQSPKYNAPTIDYSYQPDISTGGIIDEYQNYRIKNAQIDNLKVQNKILEEEAKIKGFTNWFNDQTGGYKVGQEGSKERRMNEEASLAWQKRELGATNLGWMNQEKEGRSNQWRLLDYQLEGKGEDVRQKKTAIEKMNMDMEFKSKQLEYYLVNAFGPMALKAFGMLKGKSMNRTVNNRKQTQDAKKWQEFQKNYNKY